METKVNNYLVRSIRESLLGTSLNKYSDLGYKPLKIGEPIEKSKNGPNYIDIIFVKRKLKNIITEELKQEVIDILTYFYDGLDDVQNGCGEEQPKQKEIEILLDKIKNI